MKTLYPFLLLFLTQINAQTCPVNCNGSFDNTSITTGVALVGTIPCWSTTATNGTMEVWGNGANGVSSYSGIQFVELNATMAATMFQTVTAVAGTPFSISFAHRGRAGIDTVQVSIGPFGGPYISLGKYGDGNTAWGTYTVTYTPPTNGLYEVRFTPVYWSGGNVAIGNFLDGVYVSTPVNLVIGATSSTICSGGSTTLTASGALSYTWIPISVNPTIVVSPTITTTYYLYGHSNACTDADSITIVVSSGAPVAIAGPTSVCVGSSATLTATGSTTYTWNTSANSSSIVVTPTSTTVYSVVGGTGNCSGSGTFVVTVVNYPVLSVSNVSICPGQVATLTASGAVTYTWNSPFATGANYTHNPLTTKQYTVIGSVSGCTAMTTASVILKPVPVPVISSNSPLCNAASLSLNGGGGVSYLWSGPFSFTSGIQNPLINPVGPNNSGVYTLVVTGANNCTVSANATVVVNSAPALVVVAGTVCAGETLSLSVNPLAGTTYTWTGPLNFNSNLQNVLFPNSTLQHSGIYTVIATGVNGCKISATATASVLPPPSPHISLNNQTICAQAFNGSPNGLTANFTGASLYTLSVPNYINSSNPSGPASILTMTAPYQPAGPVTVTLVGSNGACTVSVTSQFTIIPNPTVIISNPFPICVGQTYTYTASGADAYTWSAALPGSISSVSNNVAIVTPASTSSFSVIGTSLGCNSATNSSTLTVNVLPQFVVETNQAVVCLGSSAVLSTKGTGDNFIWFPSTALNSVAGSTVMFNPTVLQSHNYTVVASLNNCTNSAMVTLSVAPLPVPIITSIAQTVCVNNMITLQGSGGGDYQWNGPAGYIGNDQNMTFKVNSMNYSGIYTLTVIDLNKCKADATQPLALFNLPTGHFPADQLKGCAPYCSQLSFSVNSTSTPVNLMNWQVSTTSFTGSDFRHCFKEEGEHYIKGMLRDTNNCINQFTLIVNVFPKPSANFVFAPKTPIEMLDEVLFTNTSDGVELTNRDWYFTDNMGYRTTDEYVRYTYSNAGTYPVAMVIRNKWGCADTVVKEISVEPNFSIYVPNIFTPNEDGKNEVFLPIVRGANWYHLMVFNRWGEMLFESVDTNEGWDGSYKGQVCENGTYVWKITLFINGKGSEKSYSGHVSINR
ncbi:gliding motility-associated C-terminal domain-containing protein [Aurantibacillus circumpalustris]|uniref:T9SS type B sorting domain-containing protein n=1 Tax=Aurantibacillus circumpalustris TaxID=3036359 RepID=UPI00295BEB56|nr:gliding motility-associated C-terminal domain-containing protein [Aurantibacillus circumpalustris]